MEKEMSIGGNLLMPTQPVSGLLATDVPHSGRRWRRIRLLGHNLFGSSEQGKRCEVNQGYYLCAIDSIVQPRNVSPNRIQTIHPKWLLADGRDPECMPKPF